MKLTKPARGFSMLNWCIGAWEAIRANQIKAGPGISLRNSSDGVVISAIPQRNSTPITLPFQASLLIESGTNLIGVLAGAYQIGVTGAWVDVPETEAAAGDYAYLTVSQDEVRAVTEVEVTISLTELAPLVIAGVNATSNIPLAEVIDVGGIPTLRQRRHGNFTLGLWQIGGNVGRWAETVIGGIPPAAP